MYQKNIQMEYILINSVTIYIVYILLFSTGKLFHIYKCQVFHSFNILFLIISIPFIKIDFSG